MTKRINTREFAKACQLGTDIYFRLVDDGVNVENDDELTTAFDHAIDQYDVKPDYTGAVWASLLDQREQELGWD